MSLRQCLRFQNRDQHESTVHSKWLWPWLSLFGLISGYEALWSRLNFLKVHVSARYGRPNPDAANAHANRGFAWKNKGEYDKAIEDYSKVCELEPDSAEAFHNRAKAWDDKGDFDAAIQDYNKALELSPGHADTNINLADLLATCPNEDCRDGERAVQCAIRACESTDWRNGSYIDTLAAAYAETGDFDKAVEYQTRALELADEDYDEAVGKSRVECYKKGLPYSHQCKR